MHLLKEVVHRTTLRMNYATAFESLLSRLAELGIYLEKEDKDRGEIVARCLTSLANAVLWRSWSDKLLFKIKEIDGTTTQVDIYALPNLLRLSVDKNEKEIEPKELISRLFS